MTDTVDVRTVGWNNPNCTDRRWVDTSYTDDDGYEHSDGEWENVMLCEVDAINVKTDYCKRCNKYLRYP